MAANAMHLNATNEHYTPPYILDLARYLIQDDIHYDPTSNFLANCVVQAQKYGSLLETGLDTFDLSWFGDNAFVNPPGGLGEREGYPTKSQAAHWFLNVHRRIKEGSLQKAVFLAFNLNTLAIVPEVGDHYVCLLKKRVQYLFCIEDKIEALAREGVANQEVWSDSQKNKHLKAIERLQRRYNHEKTVRCRTKEGSIRHLTPGSSPPHHSALIFLEHQPTDESFARFMYKMEGHGTVFW
jgi:hypothetical protein